MKRKIERLSWFEFFLIGGMILAIILFIPNSREAFFDLLKDLGKIIGVLT